jgi:hypothetical protein
VRSLRRSGNWHSKQAFQKPAKSCSILPIVLAGGGKTARGEAGVLVAWRLNSNLAGKARKAPAHAVAPGEVRELSATPGDGGSIESVRTALPNVSIMAAARSLRTAAI